MDRLLIDRACVRAWRAGAGIALVFAAWLLVAAPASAAFSITGFNLSSTSSVAGAHPDLTTDLQFSTTPVGPGLAITDGHVRDLDVNLPPGLIGDTTAVPQCEQATFARRGCSPASQVGTAEITFHIWSGFILPSTPVPVYLMEPRNNEETAGLAFAASQITVQLGISVRTGSDYGLTVHASGIARGFQGVGASKITIWGVPADSSHDAQRTDMDANPAGPSQLDRRPFLSNPSYCGGPLVATASANSHEDPGTYSHASAVLPQLTGCDGQPFDARLAFRPTTSEAGVPSGYEADLTVEQNKNPDGVSAAELQTARVTLPPGVTITPGGAVGLGGCDDAQLHIGSTAPAACPDDSRIGDVSIDVPVLPKPIHGRVYLRNPLPGNLFRIVIVADDFGVHLKIPGEVRPDKVTGQLTTTFANTPQLPFSRMVLTFDGGPHAPLSNPPACGTYTSHAELTPWSSTTPATSDSSFMIDRGCGQENAFAPGFSAGMDDRTAGTHSTFRLRVTRGEVGSAISRIDTTLPRGLLANIASVPRCPEARAAVGTCGPESTVGRTVVGAGPGTSPLFVPQPGKAPTAVFLAGPYKGAPFSLSIVVPAQAGPFDLGTVVVRAGLYVDPVTAQATVRADPMPTILEGVPLNVRDIRVIIDRPGFALNPTNCDPQAVTGTITSASGQAVSVSSPFQVSGCDDLGLSPDLDLTLSGKGQTDDGKHPAVQATLTQPVGQSNLKQVTVTLPESLALDPENSQSDALCEFVDGRKTIPQCPKNSIVGSVVAKTPILDQPLTGPVYFIKNVRTDPKSGRQIRTLPTLATVLQGEGVTLVLRATSSVDDDGRLVTTFANIPDAPVSSFKLNINGGKKGILVISGADICKSTQTLDQVTDGQNGKTREDTVTIATPSCPLAVVGSSHSASALKLKVGGLGAGKLAASGNGLKKVSRTLAESTVATVSLPLSKVMQTALTRGHDVRVKVAISFKAKGAKKTKKITKNLVIHGAKR